MRIMALCLTLLLGTACAGAVFTVHPRCTEPLDIMDCGDHCADLSSCLDCCKGFTADFDIALYRDYCKVPAEPE